MDTGGYVGLLSFCSFAFSVIAAVLAIDLYALLRTGRSGSTWRVLIVASVMFALLQVLRLAGNLHFGDLRLSDLAEIVELAFVMAMAYAFFLQRKVFGSSGRFGPPSHRSPEALSRGHGLPPVEEPGPRDNAEDDFSEPDAQADAEDAGVEWARLNGQPEAPAWRASE